MTTTTTQLLTTDQNTARQITWTIEQVLPLSPAARANNPQGWTAWLILSRPKGRGALYCVWAEIDPTTNQVIRNSRATRVP